MSKSGQDHPYLHGDAESSVVSGGEADSFGSSSSASTEVIREIPVQHFTITVEPEAIESDVDPFATQWKITTCSQDSSAGAPEDPDLTDLVRLYAEGHICECLEASHMDEEYIQAYDEYCDAHQNWGSNYVLRSESNETGRALEAELANAGSRLANANCTADRLFKSMLNICSWQLSDAVQEEYLGVLGTNTRYVHVKFVGDGIGAYTYDG